MISNDQICGLGDAQSEVVYQADQPAFLITTRLAGQTLADSTLTPASPTFSCTGRVAEATLTAAYTADFVQKTVTVNQTLTDDLGPAQHTCVLQF